MGQRELRDSRRAFLRSQWLPGACLLVAAFATSWHVAETFVNIQVSPMTQGASLETGARSFRGTHAELAALAVQHKARGESSAVHCLVLCAAALCATACLRRSASARCYKTEVRAQVRLSAARTFAPPAIAAEVPCVAPAQTVDLLGLASTQPSTHVTASSRQEALAPAQLSEGPVEAQGAVQQVAAAARSEERERRQQRGRQAGERRERRKVGARLHARCMAEPRTVSFEPSAVPLKLQRALQQRFPSSGARRDAKARVQTEGVCTSDVGLQSFTINSMAGSYHKAQR
eukprot:gb/GFBE01050677.1/.p1 GENE.gb/GFBE01050677.1/~~gb/GFBE01050677.1/.p1  ORF type:complete len:289 (+),score=28.81 gb/GFBE01050677.1/:1-867(+)